MPCSSQLTSNLVSTALRSSVATYSSISHSYLDIRSCEMAEVAQQLPAGSRLPAKKEKGRTAAPGTPVEDMSLDEVVRRDKQARKHSEQARKHSEQNRTEREEGGAAKASSETKKTKSTSPKVA